MAFENLLAVKPTFSKWGGWEFEFTDARCVTLSKFESMMTAEDIVANCICTELFEISVGSRHSDLRIAGCPGSLVDTVASVVLSDIEGLRLVITDIAGQPYLGKLLRKDGYVVDSPRE